ncbi:MAG: hypothetical protein RLZZ165_428 [Bacteroidota bacterium]
MGFSNPAVKGQIRHQEGDCLEQPFEPVTRMKRRLKNTLKIIAWTIAVVLFAGTTGYLVLDKRLPTGTEGPEAEELTDKMLRAVNKAGWDSLAFLSFSFFKDTHHILWDKKRNLVEVKWRNHRALIDPSAKRGLAWEDAEVVTGARKDKLVEKALTIFWNDSFWLTAPYKARDPGTVRKAVMNDDGSRSLLVGYTVSTR